MKFDAVVVLMMATVLFALPTRACEIPRPVQEDMEYLLCFGLVPKDNFDDDDLPTVVPLRHRDSLPAFRRIIEKHSLSTNQVIESLFLAVTNDYSASRWCASDVEDIVGMAVWQLSGINRPAVTNFFAMLNADERRHFRRTPIQSMIYYTNLEPEVLSYMKRFCVKTNLYDSIGVSVMRDMFDTLSTMPDELKPAATNRVANYLYFSIRHVTDSQGWQDRELSAFLPAYSNSVQRLALMRYVSQTATNGWERSNAARIVGELSSQPTEDLNDIPWIAEP